jgi:hypothetical protein
MEDKRIGFLFYENRSGSTYLASLLDSHPEVFVTLEADFPDYLFGLEKNAGPITDAKQLKPLIEPLYKDLKFLAWEVEFDNLLTTVLERNKLPFGVENIFKTIIAIYREKNKPDARICLYKDPRNLQNYNRLKKIFSSSFFVYIYRDGRAVYNSRRRSLGSRTSSPMESNPIAAAKRWVSLMTIAEDAEKNDRFYSIRYENLIHNIEQEINKLLEFLSLSEVKDIREMLNSTGRYFERIPEEQKHLHSNIISSPRVDRISHWKEVLPLEQIYLYEKYAKKVLSRHDYELVSSNQRLNLKQWIGSIALRVSWSLKKFKQILAYIKRLTLRFVEGV